MVGKTLNPIVLWLLYDFLSLKNDVNVPSKSNKQKNIFLLTSWRSLTKIAGSGSASGSISQGYGSADPDPYQNFLDPQHWLELEDAEAKSCSVLLCRVRYACCNAIGQMSTDFAPVFEKKFHASVVPGLLLLMDDTANPRVQAHAGAALVNFR